VVDMGSASLVATAIGTLLLIIIAYVLVGGTLSTAEVVATAQRDTISLQETRMRSSIEIVYTNLKKAQQALDVTIDNTGSEIMGDFAHTDVYLLIDGIPQVYIYGMGNSTWRVTSITPDNIHPGQLDPGEQMIISLSYSGSAPTWIQVTTGSGVSDSAYL